MIEQIRKCQKCGLCFNQKPLLEGKKECQIFWVGLSAKIIKNEDEIPLSPDTNTGMLIQKIEQMLGEVDTYKTNLVKCVPLNEQNKLRYPNKKEIDSCFGNLKKEIKELSPRIVFLLGEKVYSSVEKHFNIEFDKWDEFIHSEFLPASKRYINDYVQYVKSDFLAGLGFGATQQLGETTGIYMGYSVDTGRNVYLQPSLASQGVKGTVTNALASAFVGSLGGGKSFCNNLLVYYAVLFGGQALLLDPKSERGNWKETLPEIAHEINIVNLTSDKDNAGLLDPFVIMKNVKDAESLAIDILTFLTGISSRDGEKFPVLRKAVRSVTQSDSRGLLHVIDELRREDTPISRNIADHIDSFTDYDFAHLLFSDGTVENAISLDNQLNIIQVADLVLPDKDTTFEEYTTIELLSVSMLIVISTFALDFIHSDRSIFKIVDLDEAWAFLNVAQGETLSNKLVRAGRAMQAGVYFVTQSAYDVSKESLKNNIGLKFAFRSTDINEIKQTLEFFGIDKDDENNQKRLRDLENGQCLLQDLYGRVGVVQIHPVFEELLHAFDTRPPVQRNEVE